VASRISIPLIVSGDVESVHAAVGIVRRVPCAALMVARGVLGNPWLVEELLTADSGTGDAAEGTGGPRDVEATIADLLQLLGRARRDMGDERAVRWIRSHLGWYLRRGRVRASVIHRLRVIPEVGVLEEELAILAQS
jgi:tRNA-dihydrouridine synthase B